MTQPKGNFDLMKATLSEFRQSDLTMAERIVLVALIDCMDKHGTCYPSYKYIQSTSGASPSTIKRSITSLANKGWISYEQGSSAKQQANRYQLNLERLGFGNQEQAEIIPINQPKQAQYIALDGTCFDYPTAMHEHNAKLRQSK